MNSNTKILDEIINQHRLPKIYNELVHEPDNIFNQLNDGRDMDEFLEELITQNVKDSNKPTSLFVIEKSRLLLKILFTYVKTECPADYQHIGTIIHLLCAIKTIDSRITGPVAELLNNLDGNNEILKDYQKFLNEKYGPDISTVPVEDVYSFNNLYFNWMKATVITCHKIINNYQKDAITKLLLKSIHEGGVN